MQTHEKETQLCNYVLCANFAFVRQRPKPPRATRLKTTTTRGLIVGFFDLKHMSVNHYPVLLSAADILLAVLDPAPPPPHPPQDFFSGQFGPRSGLTKCLMFCSRNKGADKTACAVCRLIFACNKIGVHTFTDVW